MRVVPPEAHHEGVSLEPFETDPGRAILDALFEINAKLADIREDVGVIRSFLGEDDGEEEEEEDR